MESKTGSLPVPGANLYYETRGAGPFLLLIAGGAGDASSYARMADYLTEQYTVVSYDRRGYARSPLEDPQRLVEIETHSDDVHFILESLVGEPVFVLGCSIGALIGLDLAIRYPQQVRALVAHEPPVPALLSGAWRLQANRMQKELMEIARREGPAMAIEQFTASLGVKRTELEAQTALHGLAVVKDASGIEWPTRSESARRIEHNRIAFFEHDTGAVARYTLDIPALKAAPVRLLPAGGRASRQTWPYQCSAALADRLGIQLTEFPGDHAGFSDHPQQFAGCLYEILRG
jgi:pimeloyl-ACP methyl ester carboxylesterase